MDGAGIITTSRGDWTALADRPAGWLVRRLERDGSTATYLTWDPSALRCAIVLDTPVGDLIDRLREAGFSPLPAAQLTRTQVWVRAARPVLADECPESASG